MRMKEKIAHTNTVCQSSALGERREPRMIWGCVCLLASSSVYKAHIFIFYFDIKFGSFGLFLFSVSVSFCRCECEQRICLSSPNVQCFRLLFYHTQWLPPRLAAHHILVSYHHYFTLLIPFNVSFLYTHIFEWVLITLAMHIEVEWVRWVRRKEEIERALPLTCDSCSQNVYAELTNVYSRCSFGQYAENDFACIMA